MFSDRHEAGIKLAFALEKFHGKKDIVVIGIPRGGVVVAWEVARYLHAPLDVVVIKKLGYPGNPEFALGATSPDTYYINPEMAESVPKDYIDEELRTKQREARERVDTLKGSRRPVDLVGKTVIVVDDGVATGASMIITLKVIRKMKPSLIVVATPIAPPDAIQQLRKFADEVVAILQPASFFAIGQFYADFQQVEDKEVKRLIAEGARG
jgi:putative phosphoribosyl transferase